MCVYHGQLYTGPDMGGARGGYPIWYTNFWIFAKKLGNAKDELTQPKPLQTMFDDFVWWFRHD